MGQRRGRSIVEVTENVLVWGQEKMGALRLLGLGKGAATS